MYEVVRGGGEVTACQKQLLWGCAQVRLDVTASLSAAPLLTYFSSFLLSICLKTP